MAEQAGRAGESEPTGAEGNGRPAGGLRQPAGGWRTPGNPTAVLIIVCAAQFMVILDVAIVNVALPSIRTGLHFSQQGLQWVVNAYTLAFAGFMLLGGRAADLLGRRRVFMVGVGLFTAASLLGGMAHSEGVLVAARAAQGLGGAIVSPATLSILSTTFREGPARNRALGAWGAVAGAGGSAGALLGGILTDTLSWRWILFVNVPIGLATILLARRFVSESRSEDMRRHYDVAGAVTVTLGLVAIVYAIVRAEANGWGSAQTLGVLGAGLALIAVFVLIEGRLAAAPLVPLRIFRSHVLRAANLAMFLFAMAMFAMWYFVTLYLQEVLGYSPLQAGLAFLPLTLGIVLGAQVVSRAVTRIGVRGLLIAGLFMTGAGLLLFAQVPAHGRFLPDVLPAALVTAAGMGATFVPVTIAAVSGVAPTEAGLASGLINMSRMMGGALGLAILSTLATSRTKDELHGHVSVHAALTDGFHRAFTVGAGFAFAGCLAVVLMLRRPREQPPQEEPARLEGQAVEAAA